LIIQGDIMEKRRLGRTGHLSTVAIFGAAAFWDVDQSEADQIMELVISHGINHIDVAPSYGQAEVRLCPWLSRERDRFFVGCKTMERSKEGASMEMRRSLDRLHIDHFDLYQIHAVTNLEELDAVTRPGGALEAIIEAREAGLTRSIGITGMAWMPRHYFSKPFVDSTLILYFFRLTSFNMVTPLFGVMQKN